MNRVAAQNARDRKKQHMEIIEAKLALLEQQVSKHLVRGPALFACRMKGLQTNIETFVIVVNLLFIV